MEGPKDYCAARWQTGSELIGAHFSRRKPPVATGGFALFVESLVAAAASGAAAGDHLHFLDVKGLRTGAAARCAAVSRLRTRAAGDASAGTAGARISRGTRAGAGGAHCAGTGAAAWSAGDANFVAHVVAQLGRITRELIGRAAGRIRQSKVAG